MFWHDHAHLKPIHRLFPEPRGVARSVDRKVLRGIIKAGYVHLRRALRQAAKVPNGRGSGGVVVWTVASQIEQPMRWTRRNCIEPASCRQPTRLTPD